MKKLKIFLAIAIGITSISFSTKASQAECILREQGSIEIPLVFEFKKKEFRTKWIYNSLEPSLKLPNLSPPLTPVSSVVNNSKLELSFCLKAENLPKPNSKFKVNFASRSLTISARPIQWTNVVVNENGQDIKIKQGKMPTIQLIEQPDPDWVIVKQAQLLYSSKNLPRIDIEVHNFTKKPHSGFELKLDLFFPPTSLCHWPDPIHKEIPVEIEFYKGNILISAGDLQFSELIRRKALVDGDPCLRGTSLKANFGNVGQLGAEEILRFRYVFNETGLELFKILDPLSGSGRHTGGYIIGAGQILITGERVYPSTIQLTGI